MKADAIVRALAATSARTDKEQILTEAFMTGERIFFHGAQLALDVTVTFGIAKAALIEDEEDDGTPVTFGWTDFLDLAGKLRRRELTGHAARDAINAAAAASDAKAWNGFYRRVLLKDLKAGCDAKTINKVLKKLSKAHPEALTLMVPVFGCQLAHDGNTDEHRGKIKGRKFLDAKLDGVRIVTVLDKDAGEVTQYTRNGNVKTNFSSITDCLRALMAALPGSVVLDGEIVSRSFQTLMTQVNRKSDVDTSDAKYALFDIIPLDDFRAGVSKRTQAERHQALSALTTSGLLAGSCGDTVFVVPKIAVDLDTPDGQASFKEFNRTAVEGGYEGIMVKDPDAPYVCDRSAAWLKIKPVISVTLRVDAVEEGKTEGKYVGTMGALVCSGLDDGKLIETNVGSGFSDKLRDDIWANRAAIVGDLVEVEADAITKSRDSDAYSLRFPRFKCFRSIDGGAKE